MKKACYLILCLLLFVNGLIMAQDAPAGLTNAWKSGNTTQLSGYFAQKVELMILNKKSEATKPEAQKLVGEFFSNNPVKGFKLMHQGKRDDSSFIIGTLETTKGNYRVNCFFKKEDSQYLINKIRIEKTNE